MGFVGVQLLGALDRLDPIEQLLEDLLSRVCWRRSGLPRVARPACERRANDACSTGSHWFCPATARGERGPCAELLADDAILSVRIYVRPLVAFTLPKQNL